MSNFRWRDSMSDSNEIDKKSRFSSYQDLSQVLQRKHSINSHFYSSQKPYSKKQDSFFKPHIKKSQLILRNSDIRLEQNTNP